MPIAECNLSAYVGKQVAEMLGMLWKRLQRRGKIYRAAALLCNVYTITCCRLEIVTTTVITKGADKKMPKHKLWQKACRIAPASAHERKGTGP
jgi:hypothetical protein